MNEVKKFSPIEVTLEANRQYYWCACGLSKSQPFAMVHIKALV